MEQWVLEAGIVLLLLILNGLFAMSELAIVSAKKMRLQQWSLEGNKKAERALELANSPTDFLSTVQIGITTVGILSGAFGGATLAEHLEDYLVDNVPALGGYEAIVSVAIVVVIITYLSIIIGELVPKRVALRSPEKIAVAVSTPMKWLSRVGSPIVRLLSFSTESVLRVLGVSKALSEPPVTEEDIKSLFEQGTQAGVFEKQEQDIMEKVLVFGDKKVNSLMTPRPDLVWLDLEDDFETNMEKVRSAPHSYFPVTRGGLDNLLGTIHVKDLFLRDKGAPFDLSKKLQPPVYIPETNDALEVLEAFKTSGAHIGFIIDEYGSIQGIVTLTDLLVAIVGDIPSRTHPEEKQIMKRDDGSYLIDGMLAIEEFKDLVKVEELPNEDRANFQTLAGFILSFLGRVPVPTDSFEWNGFKLEVVDMDGNRIDKVIVTPLSPLQSDS